MIKKVGASKKPKSGSASEAEGSLGQITWKKHGGPGPAWELARVKGSFF